MIERRHNLGKMGARLHIWARPGALGKLSQQCSPRTRCQWFAAAGRSLQGGLLLRPTAKAQPGEGTNDSGFDYPAGTGKKPKHGHRANRNALPKSDLRLISSSRNTWPCLLNMGRKLTLISSRRGCGRNTPTRSGSERMTPSPKTST